MDKLTVLWKTDNRIDIVEMVVPYVIGSKKNGWWDEVDVIIWGASQKAVSEDPDMKKHVEAMIRAGVNVHACKKCADDLCVADSLSAIGVDVLYTGVMLTDFLKGDHEVITF